MNTITLYKDNNSGFYFRLKSIPCRSECIKKVFKISRELTIDELGQDYAKGFLLTNGNKLRVSRHYSPDSPWTLS